MTKLACKFVSLSAFALSLSLSILPASAAENDQIKVTVPFAFTAGKSHLPAGDYTVVEENGSGLILIESDKGKAMLITHNGPFVSEARASGLRFQRTGKGLALTEVRMPGKPVSMIP